VKISDDNEDENDVAGRPRLKSNLAPGSMALRMRSDEKTQHAPRYKIAQSFRVRIKMTSLNVDIPEASRMIGEARILIKNGIM
jgi:hypothetical protein